MSSAFSAAISSHPEFSSVCACVCLFFYHLFILVFFGPFSLDQLDLCMIG